MKLLYKIIFVFSTLFFVSGVCLFAGGSITARLNQPSLELMLARGVPAADISPVSTAEIFPVSTIPMSKANGPGIKPAGVRHVKCVELMTEAFVFP